MRPQALMLQGMRMACASALFCVSLAAAQAARTYHPIGIQDFAAEEPAHWKKLHTHVEVEGFVTYTKREADGDLHIRVCDAPTLQAMDRKRCVVAEIIPALNIVDGLVLETHIRVRGIARYDAERAHNWWEVHPVESLEVIHNGR